MLLLYILVKQIKLSFFIFIIPNLRTKLNLQCGTFLWYEECELYFSLKNHIFLAQIARILMGAPLDSL